MLAVAGKAPPLKIKNAVAFKVAAFYIEWVCIIFGGKYHLK
jgi:hypothetical protein